MVRCTARTHPQTPRLQKTPARTHNHRACKFSTDALQTEPTQTCKPNANAKHSQMHQSSTQSSPAASTHHASVIGSANPATNTDRSRPAETPTHSQQATRGCAGQSRIRSLPQPRLTKPPAMHAATHDHPRALAHNHRTQGLSIQHTHNPSSTQTRFPASMSQSSSQSPAKPTAPTDSKFKVGKNRTATGIEAHGRDSKRIAQFMQLIGAKRDLATQIYYLKKLDAVADSELATDFDCMRRFINNALALCNGKVAKRKPRAQGTGKKVSSRSLSTSLSAGRFIQAKQAPQNQACTRNEHQRPQGHPALCQPRRRTSPQQYLQGRCPRRNLPALQSQGHRRQLQLGRLHDALRQPQPHVSLSRCLATHPHSAGTHPTTSPPRKRNART